LSELSHLQAALAVLSGSAVGFSLGLIGGGGSILAVPLLLYVVGLPGAHLAIGTSALAVAVNAFPNLAQPSSSAPPRTRCTAAQALSLPLERAIRAQRPSRPRRAGAQHERRWRRHAAASRAPVRNVTDDNQPIR
jgi:hypothetical protein